MYVINYQFVGETVEHKQIFKLLSIALGCINDLLEDHSKPIVRICISPKL